MGSRAPDWRIWLGLGLTLSWLLLGGLHISQDIGWSNFTRLPAAELGSFLEGAFAPLAFLWLVIGYFLQQKELEQNTQALKSQAIEIQRTAEQAIIQSEKMAESEVHARQEAFLQITQAVRAQLGTVGGLLFISSQSTAADGSVTGEEQSKLLTDAARDPELFSRALLSAHVRLDEEPERYNLFYGSEVRARHSNNFIFTFERMLARAREVDPDEMIRDALLTSTHGIIYSIMKRYQSSAPPELADHELTGRYIAM